MDTGKDLNRIKVMLAEKKANQQMAGRAAGERPCHSQQVVYQCLAANTRRFADYRRFAGS